MAREPEWPDKVVPRSPEEAEEATRTLFRRMNWADPVRTEALKYLQRWYDAEWSPAAVLVALEWTPEGERQRRRGGREDAEQFLAERLGHWFSDDSELERDSRLPPPRAAMSYEQWQHIVRRDHERSAKRPRRALRSRGEQARQRARQQARHAQRDALTRGQEKDERVANAFASLDALLSPEHMSWTPPAHTENSSRAARRSSLVASYAGRRATLAQHPTVRALIQRVLEQRRPLTQPEFQVLRNALSEAKSQAALGTLEASVAGSAGGVLSEEGVRILSYLDHASNDTLPVDSMIAMLDAHVRHALGDGAAEQ